MADIEEKATVLASLIAKATDDEIKNVLRLYDVSQPTHTIKKKLASADKGKLLKTTQYLGITDHTTSTKPIIIHNIICRIQNLFPDLCSFCNVKYTMTIDELPLLECALCGQGAHTPCLRQRLNLDVTQEVTAKDIIKMINPFSIPGMHYLCSECDESTIPSEDATSPRSRAGSLSVPKAVDPAHDVDATADTISSTQPPTHHLQPPTASSTNVVKTSNSPAPQLPTASSTNVAKTNNSPAPPPQPKPTCPFYMKGQCRHGISGKKDGGCPKAHPTLCHRLMTFGDQPKRGCTKGKDCDRLHPKMCPASMAKRECFTETCTLYHVKGTKRQPPPAMPVPTQTQSHTAESRQTEANLESSQIPSAFLEVLQTWKQELMASMDQKISAMQQELRPPQLNPYQAAVPHAALNYLPTQMIHPGQGIHQPMFPLQHRLF